MEPPTPYGVLVEFYRERPCRICGNLTFCRHREPELDTAEIRALANSLTALRALARGVQREEGKDGEKRRSASA